MSDRKTVLFQILSLSGGGYLGLYTITVLAELEEQTGRRTCDFIDLFAGTSIGGILSLGLAAGVPAAEIRDAFLEDGGKIFGADPPPRGMRRWTSMVGRSRLPLISFPARYTVAEKHDALFRKYGAKIDIVRGR